MLVQYYENLSFEQSALPGSLITHDASLHDPRGSYSGTIIDPGGDEPFSRKSQDEYLPEAPDRESVELQAAEFVVQPNCKLSV